MGSTIKIVISLLVIGSAAAYLIYSTMSSGDALSYFHTADEVIVNSSDFTGKKVRVGGYVEECSILQKTGTLEYRFEVRPDHPHNMVSTLKYPEAKGKTITVTYVGVVPDTFKDNAEITVGGTLQKDGTFVAQEMTAKCPSKYESAEQNFASKPPAKKDCNAVKAPDVSLTRGS
jgi:cytochrome c-type biogenesis protein CcmE